jgi:hypothetical protein
MAATVSVWCRMPRLIQYEDLALTIESEGEAGHRVRLLASPYGFTAAPFALPFDRPVLERMIEEARAHLHRVPVSGVSSSARNVSALEDAGPVRPSPEDGLRETGARLFQALFHGAVGEIFLQCRGRIESIPDRGLRIRLVLPADTADRALLQSLPWELLHSERTGGFLARNVLTPVVRQLAVPPMSSALATVSEQVRILIAVATPRGVGALDDTDERARILEAWCQQEGAEVKVLLSATQDKLYEALRSEHYHVVHFIAHGDFDPRTGAGSLVLERSDGAPDAVPGEVLAESLKANRELRLVFLNSCSSAQLGHREGQDPLLGTAAALVRWGVPAVVAMQFPISDAAARVFSEAVYRSLAGGSSLEAAVADGRLVLLQAGVDSWEWINPVLLTGQSDSAVFRSLCPARQDRSARHASAIVQAAGLLALGSYERVLKTLDSCLQEGADSADLHYHRALALLAGRRPRHLKVSELRPVEASARAVLRFDDSAAHHLCLLAAVLKDFYLSNYLVAPQPGYEEVVERAAGTPVEDDKLDDLLRLAPWARGAADEILERAGRRSQ